MRGEVQKLVVVVTGVETQDVLERWAFEVHADNKAEAAYVVHGLHALDKVAMRLTRTRSLSHAHYRPLPHRSAQAQPKPRKEIMSEIQAIIRQITASVSFLPLLEEQCTFDLLVYTDKDSEVPALWEESDPRYIKDSTEVRLRSFTTKVRSMRQDSMLMSCVQQERRTY